MNDTMIDQCEIHPIRTRLEEIQTEIYGLVPDMLTPEMIKYLDDADDWVKRFDDLAEPLGWQFSQLYRRSSVMHLCSEIVEDLDGRDLD
jgi:tetrahydromethanopterin S-methyltransferase subunit G